MSQYEIELPERALSGRLQQGLFNHYFWPPALIYYLLNGWTFGEYSQLFHGYNTIPYTLLLLIWGILSYKEVKILKGFLDEAYRWDRSGFGQWQGVELLALRTVLQSLPALFGVLTVCAAPEWANTYFYLFWLSLAASWTRRRWLPFVPTDTVHVSLPLAAKPLYRFLIQARDVQREREERKGAGPRPKKPALRQDHSLRN